MIVSAWITLILEILQLYKCKKMVSYKLNHAILQYFNENAYIKPITSPNLINCLSVSCFAKHKNVLMTFVKFYMEM